VAGGQDLPADAPTSRLLAPTPVPPSLLPPATLSQPACMWTDVNGVGDTSPLTGSQADAIWGSNEPLTISDSASERPCSCLGPAETGDGRASQDAAYGSARKACLWSWR